jgi:glucokinase
MGDTASDACYVGFDLGGTKMLAAAFDGGLKALARKRRKTEGYFGAEAGLDRIAETIDESLADAKVRRQQLAGIGVGCPGPLDLDRGILLDAPNLGWRQVPIKDALQKRFNCPVYLVNDVDGGVYGEYRFGAGRESRCVVGVFPGTGIGGGCVYEGRILRGRTGSCMEIGHLRIVRDGPTCGCGRRGCLETVASRLAVAGAAVQAAYRGQAPYMMASYGTDISLIRSGVLADCIRNGDTAVERIVRDAAAHIGVAVAMIVNLLAPDTVVLGGGMVEAMPQLFVDEVTTAARKRVMPAFLDSFRIVAATLGDDATAMGAAAWAQHCVAVECASA